MTPYYQDDAVTLYLGDCREVLPGLDPVSAVVTDPPYGYGFMGQGWDRALPDPEVWRLLREACRPGAHLASFGAPRMYHRLAVSVEDQGWEIRDCLMWLYGSGFPKSLDVSKAVDREGIKVELFDAIRAHLRRWVETRGLTRKQVNEAVGSSTTGAGMAGHWLSDAQPEIPSKAQWEKLRAVLRWDRCELDDAYDAVVSGHERPVIGRREGASREGAVVRNAPMAGSWDVTAPATPEAEKWQSWGTALKPAWEPILLARAPLSGTVAANVLAHGTGGINVDGCRIGTTKDVPASGAAARPDPNTYRPRGAANTTTAAWDPNVGRWPANVVLDEEAAAMLDAQTGERSSPSSYVRSADAVGRLPFGRDKRAGNLQAGYGDSGGASRFFYCAKASRSERERGLEALDVAHVDPSRADGSAGRQSPRAGAGRNGKRRNTHPTVKPIALMRWLVRLVTPPGGLIVDPFAGSGSTGVAAKLEGHRCVLIEREERYAEIAAGRLERWRDERDWGVEPEPEDPRQMSLL